MKKLLIVAMVCALFAPAFAVENVQVTGDIQTIGIALEDQGVTPVGQNFKGATNRVILGLSADLVEDVYAKVTFAHENVFGDYNNVAGTGLVGENLDEVWTKTHVAEAFVKISNVFDALEVKVGRQFYGDEKSAVMYFGPTYGYADPVAVVYSTTRLPSYLSLDGASVKYNGENLAVTAAYFTMEHDGTTLDPIDDLNLAGLDLDLKINENLFANAYVYDLRNRGAISGGFWGIKPTFENDNVKLGVEFTKNYALHNDKGWQVKADLALPIATDDFTFTPRVTYLKSEKDFVALGNYRPGLMFGTILGGAVNNLVTRLYSGFPVVADWEIVNAGLCMKFAGLEKWGFGLDFYTGELDNHFGGNSWEAKIVYNHNQYVAFNLTGAVLTNVRHLTASPTAVQLGMNIKF